MLLKELFALLVGSFEKWSFQNTHILLPWDRRRKLGVGLLYDLESFNKLSPSVH